MKYIDLDQPSRNSARADSANGAIESAGPVQLESPDNGFDAIPLFSKLTEQGDKGTDAIPLFSKLTEQGDKGTDDAAAPAGSIGARINDHPRGQASLANNPNSEFRRPNVRLAENAIPAKAAKESMGSTATERQTRALEHKSREIVAHEGKHAAILHDNRINGADAKPQLLERQGPDGRKYAAAGMVNADLAPIPGNPQLTEQKAEAVYRSAMSDSERSPSDESAAQQAMFVAQESRQAKLAGDPSQTTINVNTPAMGQPAPHEPIQSPYNVTMHNPLIGLAPLVAGGAARAAGAAVAGGAARTAVAGGLAPLVPVAGGAGSGAAQFAPYVDHAGRALQKLTRSTEDLDGRFVDMSEKLKIYSPELSLQKAINNIDRLNQAIEQGQRLGKPLAEFEKQKGRLDIAGGNIQADFVAVLLPIANEILRYIADVAAGVAVISSRLVPFFEKVLPPLLDFLSGVMNVIPGVLEMKLLLQWLVTLGEQEAKNRQQKANVQNLNDFFGMQVPGPRTAPDIRGPKMNMPLPQFNPLPFQPVPAGA